MSIYLCLGAKIVLTKNILNVSLSNGSTGIAKKIFYDVDKTAPGLPKLVFIDFDVEHARDMFFPNNKSRKD